MRSRSVAMREVSTSTLNLALRTSPSAFIFVCIYKVLILGGGRYVQFVRPTRQIHNIFVVVHVGADGLRRNTSRDW